jgi:hypothetical protein
LLAAYNIQEVKEDNFDPAAAAAEMYSWIGAITTTVQFILNQTIEVVDELISFDIS